jgi:type IV secretion system protein VirB4
MGHLLDAEHDGLSLSEFTVFEIEELLNLGDKYALPVLLYLFRRIERSLKGQPAAIILDEAWIMLGHPVFRAKIKEWLKVLRKANCLVLMATQSLSDAANSGILDVIVESTATKIFLPNVYARDEDTAQLYKRMGLNARQIEIWPRPSPSASITMFPNRAGGFRAGPRPDRHGLRRRDGQGFNRHHQSP